ncbi:MAG: carboxypeptidase-like regulatory domain-containing protein [bacterium]|nr:carboxypeptidase-like regulatory domain-containing protein [bacterium]
MRRATRDERRAKDTPNGLSVVGCPPRLAHSLASLRGRSGSGEAGRLSVTRQGISLIELIIAVGLMVIIFGGAYLSYSSILDTLTNAELRTASVTRLNQEIEVIRNLPYDSVGTLGGIPAGILDRQKVSTVGPIEFLVVTTIRNVDDPFDGTLGGAPNDTAPADYKLVEVEVSCLRCARFVPITMTTTVAPANLEATGSSGSLFIHVIDANGNALPEASVRVVNEATLPTIDLTDTTNLNGVLQLVGVPPGTQSYQITVSKLGYSSDRTYPVGGQGNPNPAKPYATVAAGVLTDITFAIDGLSTVGLSAVSRTCQPLQGVAATFTGAKLIGTGPDVVKVTTTTVTGINGLATITGLEWDTYAVGIATTTWSLVGTMPAVPLTVAPSATVPFSTSFAPTLSRALAIHVRDAATAAGIQNATVLLVSLAPQITGYDTLRSTDWSAGAYASKSDSLSTDTVPGSLVLAVGPGGYATSTEWLVSKTIDTGSTSTEYTTLVWNPLSQPAGANVRFQVASNDDASFWAFVGPDGTPSTYYTESGTALAGIHTNRRYLRYQVWLTTTNAVVTPQVNEIGIGYRGPCVPPDTAYFDGLAGSSYPYTVTMSGYQIATGTASTTASWQELTVPLVQL